MEADSFNGLIDRLQKRPGMRDPRTLRLSSVVAAIKDVIQREGLDVTAPRVYAKAVVTLEGTIQKHHQGIEQLVDSMYTQIALLELMQFVLPFLEASTMSATFAPTGRALRNLMDFISSLDADGTLDATINTKDDVGSIPSVLCALCKASSMLFRCASKVPGIIDEKVVRQSFRGTLRLLLSHKSERVKTIAKKEIGNLLTMEAPRCHSAILKDINGQIIASLDSISSAGNPAQKCGEMTGILGLMRSSIMELDFALIGERLMCVLVGLFEKLSPVDSTFVLKTKDSTSVVLVVNILLSAVLEMLESETTSKILDQYAGRVLATLLQVRPHVILRGADLETSSAACELFAQLMLLATRRMIGDDHAKAAMLLPLTINQLFVVATENEKLLPESNNAESWFLDLSQIIKEDLKGMRINDPGAHAKCCESCLKTFKPIVGQKHGWVYQGPLICLAELLVQIDEADEDTTKSIKTLISLRDNAEPGSNAALAFEKAIFRIVQEYGVQKFWEKLDFPRLCFTGNDFRCS